ncbi:post-GPI attachment to proteins factor 2-like isoform X2 [Physella acuta]|uniref:post-GPI attachment to proteins factor 2-like isoform X2 n=1 Tax=Physella acuta TaxID=109671 RepID=UPI0027DAEC9D|nr:post-GPI attachment to proteins factor 2-like isoform X2 [Physella acuta]
MSSETKQKALFYLPFPAMAKIVCGLPLFATLFCIIWSVIYDFEDSTATHCRVRNYLPSISAAIGGFTPQRYVWRISIALHATPRFLIAIAYYNFHTSILVGKHNECYKSVAAFTSLCHIIEVGALVGLTFISSTENHDLHETMFIIFMAGGLIYMLLTIILFRCRGFVKGAFMTNEETASLWWKEKLFLLNISIFFLSVYIYFRHNWYCEPGVYTFFAAGEYGVVVTNILFHYTAALDFKISRLSLLTASKTDWWDSEKQSLM